MNGSGVMQFTTDGSGKILYVNEVGIKMFGYQSAEEIIGDAIYDYILPQYHKTIRDIVQAAMSMSCWYPYEHEIYTYRYFENRYAIFRRFGAGWTFWKCNSICDSYGEGFRYARSCRRC